MKKSLAISLTVIIVVGLASFIATLAAGWSPKLGLDLAGGSQVVYQPAHKISSADMATTIAVITNRVDSQGVSGANVLSQGGDVVVQLPGLKDPTQVINLIGQTAQLQFRPVLCSADPYEPTKKGVLPTTPLPSACSASEYSLQAPTLTVNPSASDDNYSNESSIDPDPVLTNYPTSSPEYNDTTGVDKSVLLPLDGSTGRYLLGPTALTGKAIKSASAEIPQGSTSWVVNANLTSSGAPAWDALAKQYFHEIIGIDLDGQVVSAPLTQPQNTAFQSFDGTVQISGSFTQATASSLAQLLNYGSLPVPLKRIDTETVSATLGKSSLDAGLAAGIGGLILVLIYTIFYYRALGVVVVSGLLLTAAFLWAIVSALGRVENLTLDLAGVTGLIVSVGITVDSYIVYFERLKDEARSGRSIRTSVDRSFKSAFRTVLAADLVTFAAAVVLYVLSVGEVKGFAFFLGLSTLLDLLTTYFFTRPLVILLGRSSKVTDARVIGIARGLAVEGSPS